MKIYQRYLSREISGAVLLVLTAFLALFAFFDTIGEIRNVGEGSYELKDALLYVALRLPGRVYELMPLAVLIGTLYALSILARHSEIAVLRTAGISTGALLKTVLLVALIFAITTFAIGELVVPVSEQTAQHLRLKERGKTVGQNLRSGLWIKDGAHFINVRTVLPNAELRDILIYSFNEKAALVSIIEAQSGTFVPPSAWALTGVQQTLFEEDRSQIVQHAEMRWQSALNPDMVSVLMIAPERMSTLHLSTYIKHLAENHQKTERYSIALWKKLFYPLVCLVMAALALPFGYTHHRSGNVSFKIFTGVMIGVLFHTLNGLFSNLGAINSWPPLLSALAPSALFTLATIGIILWVERR